ncbi:MAG: hypothetical protein AAF616_07730 [Bacteroidota bacterium]
MFKGLTKPERVRTFWVLGCMGLSILVLAVDANLGESLITAEIWGYGFSAFFLALAFVLNDQLLKKLFLFAILAGFFELPADHYLVGVTKTLVYPQNQAMIWSSPLYMPFSWSVVLVEFGYVSWFLLKKLKPVAAGLLLAFLGACLVPLYEYWAISAGWWHYENTKLWGSVPFYIIIAEGLLMIPVPYFISKLEESSLFKVAFFALLEGLVMLIACLIAIQLV